MTSPADGGPTIGLTTIPRAVLSVAAGVVNTVERAMVGDSRVRTSRSNAWEAICADRDRARQRDEVRQILAALIATADTRSPAAASPIPTVAAAPKTASAGTAVTVATPGGSRQVSVGSSPRSSASQASRVSTGPAGSTRPVSRPRS